MRLINLISLIVFIVSGCCKDKQPDTNTIETVWKVPLSNGLETNSTNPILYKNVVIYSADDNGSKTKSKLVALNKETGQKVWEWTNTKQETGTIPSYYTYSYENILIVPLLGQTRQVVAINMDNGTTLWHTILPEGGTFKIAGIGDKVFHVRGNFDRTKDEIFVSDVRTGNWQSVYAASNTDAPIFILFSIYTYKGSNGRNNLAFLVNKYKDFSFQESEFTIFKYDVDSNKMVYQKKLDFISKNNSSPALLVTNANKFWLRGAPVYALDEATGDKLLEISPPMPEPISGNIAVFNDKVFMPRTYKLMCYDAKTGKYLWTGEGNTSGLPSLMAFHNDVLYFTSLSDGKFHAINATTGKNIYDVVSPDIKSNGQGSFDIALTVDTVNNRVYTATYYSAVCYKTAK
jgi:outer membrane protein assembly factor BamB